jgi:NAD(P)-dependent dehydrogenase (short-subunit alcohol dehydrogenase family)
MKGRVAILAGGTGALGQSVTMRFLAEGAVACVPFAVPAERDALSNRIEPAARTRRHFTEADVTDEASFRAFV